MYKNEVLMLFSNLKSTIFKHFLNLMASQMHPEIVSSIRDLHVFLLVN